MKKNLLYIGNKLSHNSSTPTSIESLGFSLEQIGYHITYASGFKNKVLRLLHMLYATVSRAGSTDYILIDTYSTTNFWYAVAVGKVCQIFKLKYIPILHGGKLPQRHQKSPQRSKNLFNKAYKIIAPSFYLFNFFQKEGYNNVVYIPNSIAIEKYKFQERAIFKPNLLWVRSFSAIYNPLMALKILEILLEDYPGATLCMVGPDKDGSLKTCRQYAKIRHLPVIFSGKMEKKEWIELSKEYDIFINTTHYDNTPISVIEAMALGLAVVSTNVGGIPYLLDHDKNALLVNDDDIVAFAKAIKAIINDPAQSQILTLNAGKKVENFDWQVVKTQWTKILT
ncbi:glycosyltransferase family 4 protein [Leeuwenhoekiella sp. A2]|uniref:glycosyltransferase family 4 protein n=1 Tax=Leeuwenhoekiella sp. A2 TaxID=3141460 RepID=UPI003A7F90E9